jgi:glutamyl-tRNA reductase
MLICWGVSHRTTAIAEREAAAQGARALWQARPTELAGLVPLLTCNRVELYADVSPSIALEAFPWAAEHAAYSFQGDDALHHLARVACGLDSVVLGETQIIAQVATALRAATQARTVTSPLRTAFRTALRTAERAREVAWSTEPPASIGSAAVHVALERAAASGPESRCHLLIVGAGHVARAVAAELARLRGTTPIPIERVTVLNRSLERAERVARTLGAEIGSLDALQRVLRVADVVIAATASPTPVIRAEDLRTRTRPIVVIDAGVPRNVQPEAGARPHVTLLTVDTLVARNSTLQTARERLADVVEELVAEAVFGVAAGV